MDILCAELNDTKIIHDIFRAICFKEFAEIGIMKEGLKVTIQDMKSVQASAYIPKEVFATYSTTVNDDEKISFLINLKILTECLDIFGEEGQPSLKIIYRAHGLPFCLVLTHAEGHIIADCEIKTLDVDEDAAPNLSDQSIASKFVVEAQQFVEILNFMDLNGEIIEVQTSPEPPYIQFSTHSSFGDSFISISKLSEMVVSFSCTEICSYQYALPYFRQAIKIMNLANKISVSISDNGMLALQLIIPTESEHHMYVEYTVLSFVDI